MVCPWDVVGGDFDEDVALWVEVADVFVSAEFVFIGFEGEVSWSVGDVFVDLEWVAIFFFGDVDVGLVVGVVVWEGWVFVGDGVFDREGGSDVFLVDVFVVVGLSGDDAGGEEFLVCVGGSDVFDGDGVFFVVLPEPDVVLSVVVVVDEVVFLEDVYAGWGSRLDAWLSRGVVAPDAVDVFFAGLVESVDDFCVSVGHVGHGGGLI